MPSSTRNRRRRDNPYLLDGILGDVHRSAAGILWRWRTEFTTAALAGTGINELIHLISLTWALTALTATGALLAAVPKTRRFLAGRFWCLVTRHRLQRLCWEARLHTRTGRLPLVLRIRRTEVGERAFVWCRAGISFEDFEAHTGEIRAACYARDARVSRDKAHSQLVTIDVIRRDTLAATRHVMPHIIPGTVLERTEIFTGKSRALARRLTASMPSWSPVGITRWLRRTPTSN